MLFNSVAAAKYIFLHLLILLIKSLTDHLINKVEGCNYIQSPV